MRDGLGVERTHLHYQHHSFKLSEAKSRIGPPEAEAIRQCNIDTSFLRVLGDIVALEPI